MSKREFQFHTDQYWMPEYNLMPEVVDNLHIPEKVKVYDVTLREIDQSPRGVLRADEKVNMARELGDLGAYDIEMFPVVSPDDMAALKEISSWKDRTFETSGLARCVKADIDAVAEAGADRIMLEGPISMFFGKMFGSADEDALMQKWIDCCKYAQSTGLKVALEPWDAGKATPEFLERFYKEGLQMGVDQIIFADTYNNLAPWTVYHLMRKIFTWTENKIDIVPHFHNDFGLATANTLSAVAAGAKIVHGAINSVGERPGNAAIEELVVCMELMMNIDTGYKMDRLYPVAKKFESISKMAINPNKPVLGPRTFELGSGLGVDAVQKANGGYEIAGIMPFMPSYVGAPDFEIMWGKGCGTNMCVRKLVALGMTNATKEDGKALRDKVKAEALIRKNVLGEHEVDMMARQMFNLK